MRFYLCCFILLSTFSVAQVDSIASLQRQLEKPLSMEDRIDLLNNLSRAYSSISLTQAEQMANETLQLAEPIHYRNGMATSYNNLGVYSAIQGQYTVSMDYFMKALSIREQIGNVLDVSKTLSNISRVYVYQKDFDKALEYSNKSLSQLQTINDAEAEGNAYHVLGTIYLGKGDYASALKMFYNAIGIFHGKQFKTREGSSYINIATLHERQGNFDEALGACFLAEDLLKNEEDPFITIELYQTFGSIYGKLKKRREASTNLHVALGMADHHGDGNGRLSTRLRLSDLYKSFGQFDSALFYKDSYVSLYDSIFNAEKAKQIALLEQVYQSEQKDQQLEANSNQIRMQSMIIVIISLLLVVLSIFGFVIYRFYRNKNRFAKDLEVLNKNIYDKHEEIQAQSEELMEANQEIKRINENLEQEVSLRATRIQKQNEMLIEYAYFNAHSVRGPLARILGLINLMKVESSVELIREYNLHLSTSADELDQVVRQININLQAEE